MCFGFEVGDGWYSILDVLGSFLQQDYQTAARRYANQRRDEGTGPIRGRRPYYRSGCRARAIGDVGCGQEKFGTLRFYVDGATEEQYAYIAFAEALTARLRSARGTAGGRLGPDALLRAPG